MEDMPRIEIGSSDKIGTALYSLVFQPGVLQKIQVGVSIKNLLCEQFNIEKDYVENRISIVLLNSQPVDNIDHTIIQNNDTLALSGAMPGLLGATLKRDSHLAPLRGSITFTASKHNIVRTDGIITLKLFNLISQELGPGLLRNGTLVKIRNFVKIFNNKQFPNALHKLKFYYHGTEISMDDLSRLLQSDVQEGLVFLKSRI